MKKKIILVTCILFLLLGTVHAIDLKDTAYVKVNDNSLEIEGTKVAEVKEFNDSDCINTEILSKDSEAIIKKINSDSVDEVTSVDNPREVYEYLTDNGMYYSFGNGEHTYIVIIDINNWKATMLSEMDEWCLQNSE